MDIKEQLNELEQQKLDLLNKQKELEKEANYYKLIEERDNWVNKQKQTFEDINSRVKNLYNYLSQDPEVSKVISIEEYITKHTYYNWKNEELKEEDRIENLEIIKLSLKSNWGTIDSITNDLKAELPYSISKRYQVYKKETILSKIKDKIKEEKQNEVEKNNIHKIKEELIEEFQQKYPTATITYNTEWYSYNSFKSGYNIHVLTILFENTSWVKIQFHQDKSYSIKSKYDHRITNRTKEEIIDYLAGE